MTHSNYLAALASFNRVLIPSMFTTMLGIATWSLPIHAAASTDASTPASSPMSTATSQDLVPDEVQQNITQVLQRAGMTQPIESITPSQLPNMYQVSLTGVESPLHITADGRYVLQGVLQANPSPQVVTPPQQPAHLTQVGMPISDDLRTSMLRNMSLLKNMTQDTPMYHTAIDGVIWGVTPSGRPFVTNTTGSVFTDGEVSIINEEGQFAGLDAQFEQIKNRHILSKLNEADLATYPASGMEQAVLYVATDINCPYCRQFHQYIPTLNDKGVTVKVIGFPVYPESFEVMRQVWCETQMSARRHALDLAMEGKTLTPRCVGEHKLSNHLKANRTIANGLAVYATPLLVREDGALYIGRFDSPELLAFLGLSYDWQFLNCQLFKQSDLS